MQPLILTLQLDAASLQRLDALRLDALRLDALRLDALRRAHFPRNRNHLAAHLTLFHALPAEKEAEVRADLDAICARNAEMALAFPKLRFLGKGVAVEVEAVEVEAVEVEAVEVEAPEVVALRRELWARWRPFLGAQDAQVIRPHVTICNKVMPDAARALFERLSSEWDGFEGRGVGISLWRYLGGPWERVRDWEFGEFPK